MSIIKTPVLGGGKSSSSSSFQLASGPVCAKREVFPGWGRIVDCRSKVPKDIAVPHKDLCKKRKQLLKGTRKKEKLGFLEKFKAP
eukprot:1156321-Pelagomonas_calceolata.AAC.2